MLREVQGWLLQAGRVALLGSIFALIHFQHARWIAERQGAALENVPLAKLQALFPSAAGWGDPEPHGGREVRGPEGERLGYLIQTAPDSDPFLGFSGPTNLLIGFAPDDRIRGTVILHSADTRDHVDLVERDPRFLSAFAGRSWTEAAGLNVDAVSGATLTSLAIVQGLRQRLGSASRSLKFPDPPDLAVAQAFFPQAQRLSAADEAPAWWQVWDGASHGLGCILWTGPAADNLIGYQGPTEAYVGISPEGQILGVALGRSYDNEPYVDYVRDDAYFRRMFNRYSVAELGQLDLKQAQVEGVSGATMTSLAVARGLVQAAQEHTARRQQAERRREGNLRMTWGAAGTSAVVLLALVISFTRLRGLKAVRLPFQLLLIGYLGFFNGDLLSQAMLAGWAQNGIPWRNALGLVVLTAAALLVPIVSHSNLYCHHVCPHGAAQQLLRGRLGRSVKLPSWIRVALAPLRPLLLVWVLLVALLHLPFSLVDIEPFDAYLWRAAGWATVTIAIVGLAASLVVPMAYCRHGCPTGMLLEYLRRHRTGARWQTRDTFAVACLALAALLVWLG